VGQQGNYVASFNPATEQFRRYEIEAGTNPHSLIVDAEGFVWYTGNRNGRIGKLDPETGAVQLFPMPDPAVRDPHSAAFDSEGNIWFTAQGASRIGRLDMETGQIDLVNPLDRQANPYGIIFDPDGVPWVNLFATNLIAKLDPETMAVTTYPVGAEGTRNRRIAVTPDGMIWYTDFTRGYIGRLNPETGAATEWPAPGGADSAPYAINADAQGRLWFSTTGIETRLVGFDPRNESFFANVEVSGGIRHMNFDPRTGTLWFGTDANQLGRAVVSPPLM
jgi:virginiamycin B lyase